MKRILGFWGIFVATVFVGGCATTPDVPLVFVQSNTIGISIGASSVEQGADFVLGYKGLDIAVVPIAASKPNGDLELVAADAGGRSADALSVFGQFRAESNTNKSSPKITLGKFFATGQAAKRLADGYSVKLGAKPDGNCPPAAGDEAAKPPSTSSAASPGAPSPFAAATPGSAGVSAVGASAVTPVKTSNPTTSSPDSGSAPSNSPVLLVFGEYSAFGLVLSSSTTEQAGNVTLGYKDRDFAIVPAIARTKSGEPTVLRGSSAGPATPADHDGLSVLGSFDANLGSNSGTDVGLGKFFTTGLAAKKLADGFSCSVRK